MKPRAYSLMTEKKFPEKKKKIEKRPKKHVIFYYRIAHNLALLFLTAGQVPIK